MRPNFLPPRLTGAFFYRDFLTNDLSELLQDVDMQTRIYWWRSATMDRTRWTTSI